jgi:hypothetical protein
MTYSFNHVRYHTVRIYLEELSIREGRLIKYDDTIYLIVNNRPVRVNRDKVLFVEELD